MEPPKTEPPISETLSLIAETMRVPLDKTVQAEFTPRQKALLLELEEMERGGEPQAGSAQQPD
jgi:hypothetical protein